MLSNFLLPNYLNEKDLESKAIREGFGDAINELGASNEIVVLNADLPGSLKLEEFIKNHPEQYLQVGVAEQNMAGIATGLANYGKIPFITSFAAFSPGVNFAQIRMAALSKSNIKIVGSHYGLNTGKDGPSAQMESDISMMRGIPGMVIINPADYNQAVQATWAIAETSDISYLRITREKFPVFIDPTSDFTIGKVQHMLEGTHVSVMATGSVIYEALQASEILRQQGITVDFLNIHTIKPLDNEAIISSAKKTGNVVVIEEHNVNGGLSDAVARCLAENHPTRMKCIGINDQFGESGSMKDLWGKYGFDRNSIAKEISAFVG